MICNHAIDCNFERQRHKQIDSTPQGAQQEQREQVRPVPSDLLKDPRIQPGSKAPALPSIQHDRSLKGFVHVDPTKTSASASNGAFVSAMHLHTILRMRSETVQHHGGCTTTFENCLTNRQERS